jgi:hypothetical protein
MDQVQQLAIETALKEMVRQGHFSICTIDKIIKMSGGIPCGESYKTLSLLHCVNFRDMSPLLVKELPGLLTRVLNGPVLRFEREVSIINITLEEKPPQIPEPVKEAAKEAAKKSGFFSRLGLKS